MPADSFRREGAETVKIRLAGPMQIGLLFFVSFLFPACTGTTDIAPWWPALESRATTAGTVLLIVYTAWTGIFFAADLYFYLRRKHGDPSRPPLRLVFFRLAAYALILASVVFLIRILHEPMKIAGPLVGIGWFFAAWLMTQPVQLVWKKPLAAVPGLVIADAALVYVLFLVENGLSYLPVFAPLLALGAYLHVALLARAEFLRMAGTRRAIAALSIFLILATGGVVRHRSADMVRDLDRGGRVLRVRGSEGKITSVWTDGGSGYVFYIDGTDKTVVHALNPETGSGFDFRDDNEKFVRLAKGFGDDSLLAASESERGLGSILLSIPDLRILATFGSETLTGGERAGPPTYDAVMTKTAYFGLAREGGKLQIVRCPMPLDGSPPRQDMGRYCRSFEFDATRPGRLFADPIAASLYVDTPGTLLYPRSRLFQIAFEPLMERQRKWTDRLITAIAMAPDHRTMYLGFALKRMIAYYHPNTLTETHYAEVHIHPTVLITDPDDKYLYIGSAFDGAIQVMRKKDGLVTRPIPVGPGIRGLALDAKRKFLYAATDVGVVRVDISTVEMPSGAAVIGSQETE
jgi:hypothetical protein